ncbi:MAG: glycoside hydrolase family 125 protein [Cytophagales bacterium]|nr:glycoside hydrolase family 125 protein [Cytophagales bacterium]
MTDLAKEVEGALKEYAIVENKKYGMVYAYEVNGFGFLSVLFPGTRRHINRISDR